MERGCIEYYGIWGAKINHYFYDPKLNDLNVSMCILKSNNSFKFLANVLFLSHRSGLTLMNTDLPILILAFPKQNIDRKSVHLSISFFISGFNDTAYL